jgi:hypothetical protein
MKQIAHNAAYYFDWVTPVKLVCAAVIMGRIGVD